MIAWNAFYHYLLLPGAAAKTVTVALVFLGFCFRRSPWAQEAYRYILRIPTQPFLIGLLVFAGFIRLIWILWSPHIPPAAATEDWVILRHAKELASGYGFRNLEGEYTAVRPIGYALFLSLFYRLMEDPVLLITLFQIIFSLVTIYIVYRIGVEVSSREVGMLAAIFLTLYPTSIMASKIVLEEHLFIPFWLTGLLVLMRDFQKPSWKKVIAAGVLFGIAAHLRTYAFAMGLAVAALWLVLKKDLRGAFARGITLQLMILIFAIPWAVRNHVRLGSPVLYSTAIGTALYFANNPTSDVRYPINPPLEKGGDPGYLQAENEVNRNRAGKKAAFRWIQQQPLTALQKAAGRVFYMLGLDRENWVVKDNFHRIRADRKPPDQKFTAKLEMIDQGYYGVIFLFAFLGFLIAVFGYRGTPQIATMGWIIAALIYYLSIVALTLGHRKYRFAIEPFFCLLAAYGFWFIFFGAIRRKENRVIDTSNNGSAL